MHKTLKIANIPIDFSGVLAIPTAGLSKSMDL